MKSLVLILALAVGILQVGLPAQQPVFGLHPAASSFASRGSLGTAAGEICTGFGPSIVRGLGETLRGASVAGERATLQDPDGATPELFQMMLRSGSEATGPGNTPAAILFATAPISTPPGSGPTAWLMTVSFATPAAVPVDGYFTAGVAVPAIGGGSDSLYLHTASSGVGGEHPNAPDIGWQIHGTTGVVSHPANKQLPHISVVLPSSSFRVSNLLAAGLPPLFGLGGSYPDTTAAGPMTQGIAFSVAHPLGAVANVYVFVSLAVDPNPALLPGFLNRVQLDNTTLIRAAVVTGIANGSTIPYIPAGVGALPVGLNASVVFQALVIDPGTSTLEFTNAEIVHLL